MSDLSNVGNEIGTFIGGVINPVLGGKTTQTTTTSPSSGSQASTILIVFIVVAFVAGVAYFIFKKQSN